MSGGLVTIGETMAVLSAPEGALRHAAMLDVRVGGAESNVAIAVARLGHHATWVGNVGDDGFGERVVATVRGEGVKVLARVVDVTTSVMIKERRRDGVLRVGYHRRHGPGSLLKPEDVPVERIAHAGVLHLTGITPALSATARQAVFAAAETARAAGVPVSVDINFRSRLWDAREAGPVLRDLAWQADVLFVADDELQLLGEDEAEVLARYARDGRDVVVKRGARGALAAVGGERVTVAAVPVIVVDAVGAGDAFAGGYLAETLSGADTTTRLRTAARCGAWATTTRGDWESAPSRAELNAAVDRPVIR